MSASPGSLDVSPAKLAIDMSVIHCGHLGNRPAESSMVVYHYAIAAGTYVCNGSGTGEYRVTVNTNITHNVCYYICE